MPDQEIYQCEELQTSLNYSGSELKIKESSYEKGYGVRVVSNNKIGFSFCQKEEDIKKTIKKAEELSKYSVKTGFRFAENQKYKKSDLVDKRIKNGEGIAELKDTINQTVDAINSKGANARVILNEGFERIKIENSNGLIGEYCKTNHSIYAEAMEGAGMGFAYNSTLERSTDPYELGNRAVEMALRMKNAKKIESGKYNVVINQNAIETLLEVLLPSFSGEWKRKKITKLKIADKFSDKISIYENPFCNAIGDRPFDDEGVASEKIPLIENGEVRSFLFDRETAALANENTDGACNRAGYCSSPSIGHTNIEVGAGNMKTVEEIGKYVEITSMHGSHTSNPTTGDFGMEVNIATLNTDGAKKITPVRGFIMSGNVFDLLNKVIGLEKEQRVYANVKAPKIAFSDIELVS